jgi:hypothetical protein
MPGRGKACWRNAPMAARIQNRYMPSAPTLFASRNSGGNRRYI